MGMFDSVMVECPNCGRRVEFQTKAGSCSMEVYSLSTAPVELLTDILNEPEYHDCGQWVALVDPAYPPGRKPKPNLTIVRVKTPENPRAHFQGLKWWPDDKPFTYDDLVDPEQLAKAAKRMKGE